MRQQNKVEFCRMNESGSALPLGLLVLLVLTVMAMGMVTVATTDFSIASNWKSYNDSFYAAQAGLDSGVANLRALLQTTPQPTPAQLAFANPSLTTSKATFSAYSVTKGNVAPYQTQFKSGPYTGLYGLVTDYVINARTAGIDASTANLTQTYKYIQVPLFQFAVFNGKGVDLEFDPLPPMTITGRVHANSNIYMGASNSLTFDGVVTTAGTINRNIKRTPSIPYGVNPQIKDANGVFQTLNFDHTYQPGFGSQWASSQDWVNAAKSTFGNNLQDQSMGVGQIVPPGDANLFNPNVPNADALAHQLLETPNAGDSPSVASAKLYNQAGLRIVDGMATDKLGNAVLLPPGLLTPKAFFDMREQTTMTITEVDMSVLNSSALAQPGGPLWNNGVLYVAQSAKSGVGVRLVNGSTLPSSNGKGLSVVSQNPVYVQGDYNTVNKVAASVMADAITALSNNWATNGSDVLGNQPTNLRPASNTTINAAFAMGPNAESTMGNGNGELENAIRFLEDWNGQTINYAGSLIQLWHSQGAQGAWRCCASYPQGPLPQYYNPPARNWSFDTLFNTTQPPGTPMGAVMMKGQWSRQ